MNEVNNYDDCIDSRDVEERIKYLNELMDNDANKADGDHMTESEHEELAALEKLKADYIGDYSKESWRFGAQLIRDTYFDVYAEELCKDIGYIDNNLPWFIDNAIDWNKVAESMQQDYTEIDFNGELYWTREA